MFKISNFEFQMLKIFTNVLFYPKYLRNMYMGDVYLVFKILTRTRIRNIHIQSSHKYSSVYSFKIKKHTFYFSFNN